ncbi:DNA polymerase III subunit gamma/tau [Porphyromonas sp.]|uniref:DNA polymerase III subunit gamma/tau n=1 Tax=Porphyromonas sp. TaxID=1924944 RepID=UPI0026DB3F29|nr:DNA polymerase III subunit gamma/tau [Porphyromonas sp.]MDO4771230.1 DNA polymerase III subunit gamma/tau [Porphyromonas sp.]
MSTHQVSALKFRPATFATVVGQSALTTTLKHAIQQDKLAHAYLFCGPRGVGKTTCARIFAKTINCSNRTADGEPCNECESCVSFNEQRSYNILEMDAASNNSVDDMRELIEKVRIAPLGGKYRVYIIDEVHMLSTAAFNAFLKTLEEPPAHALFILATTDKHKVLPTIISRCQVFDFSRISVDDISNQLRYVAQTENIAFEEEALQMIAVHADGGMRDALSIFDQIAGFGRGTISYKGVLENLNLLDEADYFEMLAYILMGNHTKLLLLINRIIGRGFEPGRITSGFANFLRNVLLAQDPATFPLIQTAESIRLRYQKAGAACKPALIWKCLKLASAFESEYKYCASQRLALEVTLLSMCELSTSSELNAPTMGVPTKTQTQSAPTPPAQNNTPAESNSAPQPTTVGTLSVKGTTAPNTTTQGHIKKTETSRLKERLSFSLKGKGEAESVSQQQKRDKAFTQDELQDAWRAFTATLTTQMLVKQTMRDCLPILLEDGTVEVPVISPQHSQHLHNIESELMTYLADRLENDCIQMQIKLSNERAQGERIPIRVDEKMEYFARKSEWFGKFVSDLGLRPSM